MSSSSSGRRVLFVDDDAHVLHALRNVTRRYRASFESTFALGGEVALKELSQRTFDVVVSDLRMPGLDGAELLGIVRERFPATARIVLSGFADTHAMERAIRVSHQMLGKPFDVESLRDTIERTCQVRDLVDDPQLRVVLGRLGALPAAPSLYGKLLRVLESSTSTLHAIVSVIERDPGVCTQLLRIANSPYYGVRRPVSSIAQAVGLLGTELLKGAVLSAELRSMFEHELPVEAARIDAIQQRSFLVARLMREAAAGPDREEAFVTGILHDVGSLVVAHALPAEFSKIESARGSLLEAQRRVLGVDHGAIGAYVLRLWGLPPRVVEAVAFQFEPSHVGEGPCKLLALLHAAAAVASPDRLADADFLDAVEGPGLLEGLRAVREAIEAGEAHERRPLV